MSETQVFGLIKNQSSEKLVEFKNSHGYGTSVWLIYAWKYLGLNIASNRVSDEQYEQLWALINDKRLPFHDKVVLFSTFDRAIIAKENYHEFLKCLELWQQDHGETLLNKNYVNHVESLMLYMQQNKEALDRYDFIGIQITDIMDCQYKINWESQEQIHPIFEHIHDKDNADYDEDEDEDEDDEEWYYYSSLTKISDMFDIFVSLKDEKEV